MKKQLLTLLFFCSSLLMFAQMGVGTVTPDSSAMLDVFSDSKGFLPPRIALSATNVKAPVAEPATGLLIYNTATAGVGTTRVTPGYYYWNGMAWVTFVNRGTMPGEMLYWNGTQWVLIPVGVNGSVLTLCNGVPRWGGCPDSTLVIRPVNNPSESFLYTYYPDALGVGGQQFFIGEWTHNSTPSTGRALVKFPLDLPAGATITSAKLSMYAASPNPSSGNFVDAHYGSANAMLIQRITSNWSGATVTWNSQPSVTTVNQVTVPHTNNPAQNDLDIDVTQLVKDMQREGNNGFLLRLMTTSYYNCRQYFSSYSADVNKLPKLVITYK